MEAVYDSYLEKFGEHPEVFVGDTPEEIEQGMREALRTGRPWRRKEREQEGVRW